MHSPTNSLRRKVLRLRGEQSLQERTLESLAALVGLEGQPGRFVRFLRITSGLGLLGAALGIPFKNLAAPPLLALTFMTGPVLFHTIYRSRYNRHIALSLEGALSLISASYIRTNNLVRSVRENLRFLDPILRRLFEEFLAEQSVNVSMERAILHLSGKLDNAIFKEWCAGLVKAYTNTTLREELTFIVSKLSTVRIIQESLDVETRNALTQYVLMLFLLIGSIPLIYWINYGWFLYFFNHPFGKLAVAVALSAFLTGLWNVVRFSKPIRFDR